MEAVSGHLEQQQATVKGRRLASIAARVIWLLAAILAAARPASGQPAGPLEAGAHVALLRLDEFALNDVGVGGRVGVDLARAIAIEAELTLLPSNRDAADDGLASRRRVQGLVGAKLGVRGARAGVFGKVRPGFVRFQKSDEPVACIQIFPPPLACQLAEGKTVFALDVGAVTEFYPSPRSVIRIDVGDTILRFDDPVFRPRRGRSDGFTSHNLQVDVGLAARF